MCFNAESSFIGAAVVAGLGVATLTQVRKPREIVYGALPLAFAVHQFLEGMTWLQLDGRGDATLSGWSVHLWVFYAWALLPLWVPFGVWLLEPDPRRRRWLAPLLGVGAIMLAVLGYAAIQPSLEVRVVGESLDYVLPIAGGVALAVPYLVCTCIAPMLSSFRWIRVFGVANAIAVSIATAIKAAAFASIWCTFAAFLSALVLVHFVTVRRAEAAGEEPAGFRIAGSAASG